MCIVAWNPWLRQSLRRRREGGSSAPAELVAWGYDIARLSSRAAAVLGVRGGVREQENSMTFHLDWLKTGRAPRGTPRRRGPRRRLVVMNLIAGLALIQAGCQSGPFSNCGGCSSCGFFKRATDRILHRDAGCCGSGAVGGSAVEYGTPSNGRQCGRRPPRRCTCRGRRRARCPRPCRYRPTIRQVSRPSPRCGTFRSPTAPVPRPVPEPSRWVTSRGNRRPRQPSGSTRVFRRKPRRRPGRGARRPSRLPATTTIRSTICRRSGCPAR